MIFDDLHAEKIWYLKPIDTSNSLIVFAIDDKSGDKIFPLFSTRQIAVEFVWQDSRYIEHVEPVQFRSAAELVFLLNWLHTKGFTDVGLDPTDTVHQSCSIQDACHWFGS